MNGSDPTGLAGGPGEAGCTGRLAGLGMCPAEIAAVRAAAGPVRSDIGSFVVAHHTAIEVGIGVALAVVAAATGVGAGAEGVAACPVRQGEAEAAATELSAQLGGVSLATGSASTLLDGANCTLGHNATACVGLGLGLGLGLVSGVASGAGELGVAAGLELDTPRGGALFSAGLFGTAVGIAGGILDTASGVEELSSRGGCGDS